MAPVYRPGESRRRARTASFGLTSNWTAVAGNIVPFDLSEGPLVDAGLVALGASGEITFQPGRYQVIANLNGTTSATENVRGDFEWQTHPGSAVLGPSGADIMPIGDDPTIARLADPGNSQTGLGGGISVMIIELEAAETIGLECISDTSFGVVLGESSVTVREA